MRPLDGITVVTLEHAIAAPFCTRQLADLGARVIKVERPGSGDFARAYDERVRGLASHFVWTNRSKESLTLDVKHPRGAGRCWRKLLERADVLVQNLAPGAAARLGLSLRGAARQASAPDRLRHLGLRRRRPVPRQEGLRPADPERVGLPVDHRLAGRAGEGRLLDRRHRRRHVRLHQHPGGADPARPDRRRAAASTSRCSRAWSSGWATRCTTPSTAPTPPPRAGAAHATIYPYGPFPAGDGKTVMLGLQNEREWAAFCEQVLRRPELATDERFASNSRRSGQARRRCAPSSSRPSRRSPPSR